MEESLSNDEIGEILFPGKCHAMGSYAESDYVAIHKELANNHAPSGRRITPT